MFSLEALGLLLAFSARYAESEVVLDDALVLATNLGARRFQAIIATGLSEALFARGRTDEARQRNEQALAYGRESGNRFFGPVILSFEARMQDDPTERERCRAEAEALLADGGIGHSPIAYHRIGIEDALARGEWERMRAHVAALEACTRDEPLPYTDLLIARGRVLATLGESPGDAAARAELVRLKDEFARLSWPIGWP